MKCNKCGINQNESNFYASKTCKQCIKDEYRTLPKLIRVMYNSQVFNCKHRGDTMNLTRVDFEAWILSQPNLYTLYSEWIASGWSKESRPSVDRLDDYATYSLTNIRLVTWKENKSKGHKDRKSGVNGKVNHKLSVNGLIYPSKNAVIRATGLAHCTIMSILAGKKVHPKNAGFVIELV